MPEDVLPTTIIPLFGILSQNNTIEGECHFCFEKIEREELLAMKTPCCQQTAHCRCFRTWATLSLNLTNATLRCAYCRATFPDEELCFLCLEKKNSNEQFTVTNCCQTTVHEDCIKDLRRALLPLSFEFTLECSQQTWCGCIWTAV